MRFSPTRTELVQLLALVLVEFWHGSFLSAQSLKHQAELPNYANVVTDAQFTSPFTGKWSYRSFISDPNLATPVEDLLFGAGTLELAQTSIEKIDGSLSGDGWSLTLVGSAAFGNPATIQFEGQGTIGGELWIYDYTGYLVPVWPNGKSQRPSIVGTIVRTKPHTNGQAEAGVVAQWIAVRQDSDDGQPAVSSADESAMPVRNWTAEDFKGKPFSSETLRGHATILVFSKGFDCLHCAEQVNVFSLNASQIANRNAQVVFIVSETQASLQKTLGTSDTSFVFLADPDRNLFTHYGLDSLEETHGIVIQDSNGTVQWDATDSLPILSIRTVLEKLEALPDSSESSQALHTNKL